MKKYDYLVVGSGLYGAVFAQEAREAGKSVLVIDKRSNIAGNVYTEEIEGINVHKHGLQSSTDLQTARLPTTMENCILSPLICIHLIKCGEW